MQGFEFTVCVLWRELFVLADFATVTAVGVIFVFLRHLEYRGFISFARFFLLIVNRYSSCRLNPSSLLENRNISVLVQSTVIMLTVLFKIDRCVTLDGVT